MKLETPLGEPRTEVIGGHKVTATRSKKIFQLFKWKGSERLIKPDPNAPCIIDESIEQGLNGELTGFRGICKRCRREVEVKISPE
jgi:hypothetical protein